MRPQQQSDDGFTLIEALVALVIMVIVGLMAWRGMDAMIRGRENIESRSKQDAVYTQLMRQFERDCNTKILNTEFDLVPYAVGTKNIWWIRNHYQNKQHGWAIVGYGVGSSGLKRITSQPLFLKSDVMLAWLAILQDPDLITNHMQTTLEIEEIHSQHIEVITSTPNRSNLNTNSHIHGVNMTWLIRNQPFPITRSCLLGSGQ